VLQRSDVSVCLQDPRFGVDLVVTADLEAFYEVWLGGITLGEAMTRRSVRMEGMPAIVRAFPQWFAWSPMAGAVRATLGERPAAVAAR
jgi:hypothetical protein